MIIWINGTFGVGKTTAAEIICDRTAWRVFDPEHVGYLLAGNLKDMDFDDFQDLPPWRALVPVVAGEIYRYTDSTAMVAVQSVLIQEYWSELVAGFAEAGLPMLHVLLHCEQEELRRRIETDKIEPQAREWRLGHLTKYEDAREWLTHSADVIIDTTKLTPEVVARNVVQAATEALTTASQ